MHEDDMKGDWHIECKLLVDADYATEPEQRRSNRRSRSRRRNNNDDDDGDDGRGGRKGSGRDDDSEEDDEEEEEGDGRSGRRGFLSRDEAAMVKRTAALRAALAHPRISPKA